MQSCFSSRFLFIPWRRSSLYSKFVIFSPYYPFQRLFSASADDLDGLVGSNSKSFSIADFSFLTDPNKEVRSQEVHFVDDAGSICDLIAKSDDNFGEKTQRFLRKYRDKLDGSLVASVLRKMVEPNIAVKFFIWAGRQIGYTHTSAVYDVMVKILSPGGHDLLCDRFVNEIGEEGEKEVVGRLLNTMVRKWCFGGEWKMALEELGKLKERGLKPSRKTYYALIRVFLTVDMVGSAKEVRSEMVDAGFALDGPTMAAFVYTLCKKEGGWKKALRLMEKERFVPDTVIYTRMIDGLCESSRFEDASLLLDVMCTRSCLPNTATYTVFLAACLREKKMAWCKRVLRMMILQGCYPNHSLFHAIIHLFCTHSDYFSAYNLLCKMEAFPCPPRATAYNIFIGSICGREESEPLLPEALELAEKAYKRLLDSGMALNKVNVCRFAHRLTEAGKFEKASNLIHDMMGRGFVPDCTTYAKVIHLLCNASYTEKAFSLFEELKRSGLTPDVFLYTMLIDLLGKAGLVRQAGTLFSEMVASGCTPSVVTFTSLLHAHLKAGKLTEAGELFHTMISHGCVPNTVTYTALIDGYCKAGEVGRAQELFDGMHNGPGGCAPDVLTYGAMVAGLCRSGRVDEAEQMVEGMAEKGCDPNEHVYHPLIDGFCKAGRLDRAQRVVEKMVECRQHPNVYVYGSLIDRVFKDGRTELALPVIGRMMNESCLPNVVVFTEMVDGLCKAGKVEEAGKMMKLMAEKGYPPNVVTYTAMMDGLGRSGKVREGLELLDEMWEKGCAPNMVTYRVLINHCCAAGMVEKADELLTEMKQTCWPKQIWEYKKVIEGFSRDFVASLGVLDELGDADMVSILPVCGAVIDSLCRSGRLDRALELKEEVCPKSTTTTTSTTTVCSPVEKGMYSALLEGLSAAGKVEKAFEIYVEMETRGGEWDSVMFWYLVKGLLVANRWGDALLLCYGLCSSNDE